MSPKRVAVAKKESALTVDSMNDRATEDRKESASAVTKSAMSAANNIRADVSEKSNRS